MFYNSLHIRKHFVNNHQLKGGKSYHNNGYDNTRLFLIRFYGFSNPLFVTRLSVTFESKLHQESGGVGGVTDKTDKKR